MREQHAKTGHRRGRGRIEDNLVVAAAQRADATYLVTNDEALIKHAPVAALAPADALALLKATL